MTSFRIIEDKPRIILFAGSNRVASEIWKFLIDSENVVHTFNEKDDITLDAVKGYKPDVMITCYWPYLLKPEMFNIPKYGTINFHPALLPYNRGWYPSIWPFIDGSPAGVTLHLIDEGADTGPIIIQEEIPIEEEDNGGTIYKKSQDKMIELFIDVWPKLKTGIELQKQDNSKATYHSKKDANELDEFEPLMLNWDTIQLIKAKTFGDKCFAYYTKNGVKYKIHLTITKE